MKGELGSFAVVSLVFMSLLGMINGSGTHDGPFVLVVDSSPITEEKGPVPTIPDLRSDMEGYFTENLGQLGEDEISYYTQGDPVSAGFGEGGVVYSVGSDSEGQGHDNIVFRVTYEDSNSVRPIGLGQLGHSSKYFFGNESGRWVTGARSFSEIRYQDLWDGIDLRFYFLNSKLKYEFEIEPGYDPSRIVQCYEGIDGLSLDLNNQDLLIKTPQLIFRDDAPYTYQEYRGCRVQVDNGFELLDDDRVTFDIGPYNHDMSLVIDPGMRFSSFLGGNGQDSVARIHVDSSGVIYITGSTSSQNFKTTNNAMDMQYNGNFDIYVAKLKNDGSGLLYSTFIGGSGMEGGASIKVDTNGQAYICGGTTSTDFPTTNGALERTHNSGQDVFVCKINAAGNALLYSTYVGDSSDDFGLKLSIDGVGNAFVAGGTSSSNFPTTTDSFDTSHNARLDTFVMKVNNAGNALLYSTFVGGSLDDRLEGLSVDSSGRAFITGWTRSSDFPTTDRAYDTSYSGGETDVFVSKLDAAGSDLVYSTFIGGGSGDWAVGLVTDDEGCAYVTGNTASSNFPTTAGSYDTTNGGGYHGDIFILKLSSDGSGLHFSTFVGVGADDIPKQLYLNSSGGIYVTGYTESQGFPTTAGAYDTTHNGGLDCILLILSADGTDLEYSTLFGAGSYDDGNTIFVDGSGLIYIGGRTKSTEFPTTQGVVQSQHGDNDGEFDGFVCKFDLVKPLLSIDSTQGTATTGDSFTFNISAKDNDVVSNVTIEYWFGGSADHVNRQATLTHGSEANGTWVLSINISRNSLAPLNYIVHIEDPAENILSTRGRDVPVLDNDMPTLDDITDDAATTGNPFHFGVVVNDNIGVGSVFLVYWFDSQSRANVTMRELVTVPVGNGSYGYGPLIIPEFSTSNLYYYFAAVDMHGNWNGTVVSYVSVTDANKPVILDDLSDGIATTGENIDFTVDVSDNIGVLRVFVVYWFGSRADDAVNVTLQGVELNNRGNGTYSFDGLVIPTSSLEPLSYFFVATDSSGNWNRTVTSTIEVRDNDPPELGPDSTPGTVIKGLDIAFSIQVNDNIGVAGVYVGFRFGDGTSSNMSMTGLQASSLEVTIPRYPEGPLHYTFHAVDSSGIWNSTHETICEVVNVPPTFSPIPVWNVREGEEETIDLTSYIDDQNDALSNLVLSCDETNVSVKGLSLITVFDVWVADFLLEVAVTDGGDMTYSNVTIHVTNVNDPPVFTSSPVVNGTVNRTYRYQVRYLDEDPSDIHSLTLLMSPDGMIIDGDDLVTWTPVRGQHSNHMVNLSLTDGYATVYQTWTIHVNVTEVEPGNLPPFFVGRPRLNATAGEPYRWDADAIDPNGDILYFLLLEAPEGAHIDSSTGLIEWLPPYEKRAITVSIPFTVEVTDGNHLVPLTFVVRLRYPPDLPPEIQGRIPDIDTTGKYTIDLTCYMFDPDDHIDNLTWRIEDGDETLFVVRIEGNELTITPWESALGSSSLVLVLEDPSGLSDSQSIIVGVESKQSWLHGNFPLILLLMIIIISFSLAVYITHRRKGKVADATTPAGDISAAKPKDPPEVPVENLDQRPGDDIILEVEGQPLRKESSEATHITMVEPSPERGPISYIVEQVYIVHRDGRLIAECAREECVTKDGDLMSGMLIAIQGFIQDGLESGGKLESIKYGDNLILLVNGEFINVAAVIYGKPDDDLLEKLETTVHTIQAAFAGIIEEWDGDYSMLAGIEKLINPLLKPTEHLSRDDVGSAVTSDEVSLISAIDFYHGYVRLKTAAVNMTDELLADASIEVYYNSDMLLLEHIEPAGMRLRGDRVLLGNIKPGERTTVAFLFDPQICQGTTLDGNMTYIDAMGARHRVEMKRRHADVVCPIFFTKENANTAMLRRLIKDKLHSSDLRVFKYPRSLMPQEVLKLGKISLGREDIQLVREFVNEGPPYEAEVWYYGETKIVGHQIVIRVGVVEEKHLLEFFAASTAMVPITGLLAEFRREIFHVMNRRYMGEIVLEPERDEKVRHDLESRPLLIDMVGELEIAPDEAT